MKHLLRPTIITVSLVIMGCSSDREINVQSLRRAPIVGIVEGDQANIAIIATLGGRARIVFGETGVGKRQQSAWQNLKQSEDYSASLLLTDLKPDAAYQYQIEFGTGDTSDHYQFSTFPTQNEPGKFSFVFSACFRERYRSHVIFDHIRQDNPTFMALLGDNMYGDYDGDIEDVEPIRDDPKVAQQLLQSGEYLPPGRTVLEVFRTKYQRNFDRYFQSASSTIPVMAIWDDHDYGDDNSDKNYPYKAQASKVFKETFPRYPFVESDGSLFYKFTVADVEFFVLDNRWYRDPMQTDNSPEKTMLGATQLQWLLDGLRASTATYKFIVSSVSWNDYGGDTSSGRPGLDSWSGYLDERDHILAFIKDRGIKGTVIFSGDQHYPSAHILNWDSQPPVVSEHERSITYSFNDLGGAVIDFSSSPLSYHRASGGALVQEHQLDSDHSYEIYRAPWGLQGPHSQWNRKTISSVYGYVQVDTQGDSPSISVTFKQLNWSTNLMEDLYTVKLVK